MISWLSIFLLFFHLGCLPQKTDNSFQYRYRLSPSISFNDRGTAEIGFIDVTHDKKKALQFWPYPHSPHLYLYDKNTKKCHPFPLVLHNLAPEKLDSPLWALLNSASYSHTIPPGKPFRFTVYLNLNILSRNTKWMKKHMKQNTRTVELHIFDPLINKKKTLWPTPTHQEKCPSKKPDFKITEIRFAGGL